MEAKHEPCVEDCSGFVIDLIVNTQKVGYTFAVPPVRIASAAVGPIHKDGVRVYGDGLLWSK